MKIFFLYLMALAYIAAGVNHFWHPGPYVRIMPSWLPAPRLLVLVSGGIEILLGVLLLIPQTRIVAAWGIIALLVAVFPANLQMALNYAKDGHPHLWLAIARLPLQLVLIGWAYAYTR